MLRNLNHILMRFEVVQPSAEMKLQYNYSHRNSFRASERAFLVLNECQCVYSEYHLFHISSTFHLTQTFSPAIISCILYNGWYSR